MKFSLKLYIYIVVCRCGFSVIQVKASKFTEKEHIKRTESQGMMSHIFYSLF